MAEDMDFAAPIGLLGAGRMGGALIEGWTRAGAIGARTLIEHDLNKGSRRTLASNLPVGSPPGVVAKPLRGFPPFTGPMGPFAGLAAGPDGRIYLSADGDGSVLALRVDDAGS